MEQPGHVSRRISIAIPSVNASSRRQSTGLGAMGTTPDIAPSHTAQAGRRHHQVVASGNCSTQNTVHGNVIVNTTFRFRYQGWCQWLCNMGPE